MDLIQGLAARRLWPLVKSRDQTTASVPQVGLLFRFFAPPPKPLVACSRLSPGLSPRVACEERTAWARHTLFRRSLKELLVAGGPCRKKITKTKVVASRIRPHA